MHLEERKKKKKIRDGCVKYLANKVIRTASFPSEMLRLADRKIMWGLLQMKCQES